MGLSPPKLVPFSKQWDHKASQATWTWGAVVKDKSSFREEGSRETTDRACPRLRMAGK